MVSQSNAAGSSGRRRRPNTPKAKPVSRSKKTKRYLVSDSDDDTTPSSMDSTAPTSPPVDAVDVGSSTKFLRRLFAPGFFLTQLRLNIYSKANVIASVASVLKGSSAMDRLLCSQFSKLFQLPVARCPNSTKLIGSLLCRQLITIRKYELCVFDVEDSETEVNEPCSMWKQLFDTTRWWTGFCVVLIKHSSSPKYVEMLSNLESFMNYPWGRTSFLHTISHFLPPPVSVETPDPLHVLRIRLSQKTTACYGFPLALQLLAFEAVPQLLGRIPDADNTEDFLDNPSCCGNTVVILNTNDIVAVEGELDVIVDFSLVPEAERHFWLDEVEDPKVTRLVDHIRSGHTFRTEDFEGGDRSFGKDNAIPEGKPQGVPLIQRTLRPRKCAAVVIEDLTTPEYNEPDVLPELGRSPNEDLKSWILEQFQNFKNGIYERLDQFEKTLCDHFGVPLPNIHNKGKRKRPNRKSRKINSTVPKPGPEMHSYPLRSADGLEGAIGNTQPGFSRETRENNENSTLLTPQFDQNATDQGQFDQNATYQPHTPNAIPDESQTPNPLTTLTIYRGLLFARPQSYVSPAKKDDTYIGEKAVDVKWDEANPHAYSAVKEVPAGERPSSDPNPESAPDFASTRSEDNVGPVSTNLSGQKTQEPVIEGGVPDSIVVQNPTSPVEEDENYESWKENISFDSQLQGKRPQAVEDMPGSETDEDENYVESSGKRVPKKSQKIRGVYTPDARLKGLFMSEKKLEYRPLPKTNRAIFKKFSDILSENVEHEAKDKLHFDWGTNIASYVTGMCRGKNLKLQLGRDIDVTSNVTIFDSFITANPTETHVDAHMTHILKSLPYILEQYVRFTDDLIKEGERTYAWNRFQGIYHNNRGGDCGPCAAKFMEMYSNGDGKEEMSRITDKVVDKFCEQYAMDCYEEFVGDFQVANEAEMK
uniref:Ubiquitin-like protease family profile domain-containing protein n=1 Tax=Brassica oleracea var. oleracea TaxID=109376 RepID=A0A0D3AAS6_BRAOL